MEIQEGRLGWGELYSTVNLLPGKLKNGTEGLNKLHSSLEDSWNSDRSMLIGAMAA